MAHRPDAPLRTVGVVLHPSRDSPSAAQALLGWAAERDVRVLALPDEARRLGRGVVAAELAAITGESDLLLCFGGDGTMLRALRMVAGRQLPVLGVNMGKLGFLAEIDAPELSAALASISAGDYSVEPRTSITARVRDRSYPAFNDVALLRSPGTGLGSVGLVVAEQTFVSYSADAVVVSTPTGSTAYSFSAGGPLVSPTVEAIIVTPVAPHSAFNRAVILDADEELSLVVRDDSARLALEVDGALRGHVEPGERVSITATVGAAHVVRLGTTTFYQRARRKLRLTGSALDEG